jgi:hypothetical protein
MLNEFDDSVCGSNGSAVPPSDSILAAVAEGTLIATLGRAVPVERLQPGEHVLTGPGTSRTVTRIAPLTIAGDSHPAPDSVAPMAIAAGAFGADMPSRALLVAPDLTILLDGALIPARLLVNNSSIRRAAPTIVYWFVELDAHDVILAEGLPVGAYLDPSSGARDDETAAERPAPGPVPVDEAFAPGWDALACAPLIIAGPALDQARLWLEQRSRALGLVEDADQFMLAAD